MSTQLLNIAMMLVLTIGFFIALMFLVKYLRNINPRLSSSIEIIGGASISHKGRVVLIQSEDRKILLGVTENSINKLHVFDEQVSSEEKPFFETFEESKEESLCQE